MSRSLFSLFTSIAAVAVSFQIVAQSPYSIHYYESVKYNSMGLKTEKVWDDYNNFNAALISQKDIESDSLKKEVFGWHPYWMGSSYLNYDYSLLSEISYFSYDVDPLTGEASNMHEWLTTGLVDLALSHGIRVSLTVTLFDDHELFLTNAEAINTLINNLVNTIQLRNAHGVNIDFEAIAEDQKDNFTAFMMQLCDQFHGEIPGSKISIALPAVDWRNVFNVSAMNNFVDLFLIMGYGYHWSGSDEAGPNSPKNCGSIWPSLSITRSINYYLEEGISPGKLCLAVPYYGRDWGTVSDAVPSSSTTTGATVRYSTMMDDYANQYTQYWDDHSSCPAFIYQNALNNWHQCWVDNAQSLGYKYDVVNLMDIAGIGIWAMGYEGTYTHLTEMIAEKFTDRDKTITEGIFTDTGGPHGKYFENEDWTFTLYVPEEETIELVFESMNIEQGADSLMVYDGDSTDAPLLNVYTGLYTLDDTLYSQTNALTFHFISNALVEKDGWVANWSIYEDDSYTKEVQENHFTVMPNPFNDAISISYKTMMNQMVAIQLINVSGETLHSSVETLSAGKHQIVLNVSDQLLPGTYILRVQADEKQWVQKVIKK